MKYIFITLLASIYSFVPDWHFNIDEAKQLAKKEHKHILLNFSGSDWCGPCIRMRKEIFQDIAFEKMADTALVLVNADFPRMKKNQLPARQQAINNVMADKYNPKGRFPQTVLLNADGKLLKEWDGYPGINAKEFCDQVMATIESDK